MGFHFNGRPAAVSVAGNFMSEPGILGSAASGLREALAHGGAAEATLLWETGLDAETLGDPAARIPLHRFVRLLELAARRTRDHCFGLRVGAAYPLSKAGVLWHVLLNSPTIGGALRNLVSYLPFQVEGAQMTLSDAGRDVLFSYQLVEPKIAERRHYNERSIAIIVKGLRRLVGGDFPLKHVLFEHVTDGTMLEHRRFFGSQVTFDQGTNAIVFDRRLLDREIASADPHLLAVLKRHVESHLSQQPHEGDIERRLQHYVTKSLQNDRPRLEEAARDLGMSPRTLQRRLKARGLVFAYVVEETRRQLAEGYLSDSSLTASEVAYLLGYSEPSAFTRAYRRWTGSTPMARRRQLKP